MTRLGEAMKKKREELNYTATEAAYKLNMSLSDYSIIEFQPIEWKKCIYLVDYLKICIWLGVDPKNYLEDYK